MIALFFKRFGAWIAALASIVGMGLTLWFSAKRNGKAEAQVQHAEQRAADHEAVAVRQINETQAAAAAAVSTVKEAANVQVEVSRRSDDDVNQRLRDEWSRD